MELVEVVGTANCYQVTVRLTLDSSPNTQPATTTVDVENEEFRAPFYFKPPILCGTKVEVVAVCRDARGNIISGCETKGPFNVECKHRSEKPQYVSYYDCSGWNSTVEIMNLQPFPASFRITNYSRDGQLYWEEVRNPNAHETIQISLDRKSPTHEGLVVVSPLEDGHEFPSMLIINEEASISRRFPSLERIEKLDRTEFLDWLKSLKTGVRFVPFIRVP